MNYEANPYISYARTLSLKDLPEYHRLQELYVGRRGYEFCDSCLCRLLESAHTIFDVKTGNVFCSFECKKDFDRGILSPKNPKIINR